MEKSKSEKEACGNCRFWKSDENVDEPVNEGPIPGSCHRKAPAAKVVAGRDDGQKFWALWPGTWSGDFCGEWEKGKQKGKTTTRKAV